MFRLKAALPPTVVGIPAPTTAPSVAGTPTYITGGAVIATVQDPPTKGISAKLDEGAKAFVAGVKVAVSVGLPGLGVHDIRVVASPGCPVAAKVPVETMLLFWSRTVMVPDGATELLSVSTSAKIGTSTPGCTLPGTKRVVIVGAATTTTDAVPS
jgi:hypothetical protein